MLCIRKQRQDTMGKPSKRRGISLVVTVLLREWREDEEESASGWRRAHWGESPEGARGQDKWLQGCGASGAKESPWFQRKKPALHAQDMGTDFYLQRKAQWSPGAPIQFRGLTISPHYIRRTWTAIPRWKFSAEIHLHCPFALTLWTSALFNVILRAEPHFKLCHAPLGSDLQKWCLWLLMETNFILHMKTAFESDIPFL